MLRYSLKYGGNDKRKSSTTIFLVLTLLFTSFVVADIVPITEDMQAYLEAVGIKGKINIDENVNCEIDLEKNILTVKTQTGEKTYPIGEIIKRFPPTVAVDLSKEGNLRLGISSVEKGVKIKKEDMKYMDGVTVDCKDSVVQVGERTFMSAKVEFLSSEPDLESVKISSSEGSTFPPMIKHNGKRYQFEFQTKKSVKVGVSDSSVGNFKDKEGYDLIIGEEGKFSLRSKGFSFFEVVDSKDGTKEKVSYKLLDNGEVQKSSSKELSVSTDAAIQRKGETLKTEKGKIKAQAKGLTGVEEEGSLKTDENEVTRDKDGNLIADKNPSKAGGKGATVVHPKGALDAKKDEQVKPILGSVADFSSKTGLELPRIKPEEIYRPGEKVDIKTKTVEVGGAQFTIPIVPDNLPNTEVFKVMKSIVDKEINSRTDLTQSQKLDAASILMVEMAKANKIGYRWGGDAWDNKPLTETKLYSDGTDKPHGVDCSGYVSWIYKTVMPDSPFAATRYTSTQFDDLSGVTKVGSFTFDQGNWKQWVQQNVKPGDVGVYNGGHVWTFASVLNKQTGKMELGIIDSGYRYNTLDSFPSMFRHKVFVVRDPNVK